MTPEEIVAELERLKERVNDEGKGAIDRLKEALSPYFNAPKERIVEKPVVRRADVRDASEGDQHKAENLGYVPRAKKR